MAPILTLLESEQMRVHSRHIARRHASHRGGFDLTTTLHHFFNSYSKTYGSLDAVIILMLWFYITGLAFLVGGEINSTIEHAAAEHDHPEAKAEGQRAA
jgi:hypothetical protein